MAKPTIKKDAKYYQWQLIRLNKDYCEAYECYRVIAPLIEADKEQKDRSLWDSFMKITDHIKETWGCFPHDPDAEIPPVIMHFSGAVKCKTRDYHFPKNGLLDETGLVSPFPPKSDEELGTTRFINLTVDIHASDSAISEGVMTHVKKWREYARKIGKKRRKINQDYLDECLELHRSKKKFRTIRDLAKSKLKVSAKATNYWDRLLAEESRIGKLLQECEALISGGYRNITL